MDRVRSPFPCDIDVPVRFLGRFTVKDFLRISVCIFTGYLVLGELGAAAGVVLGLILILYKPYGQALDTHAKNCLSDLHSEWHGFLGNIDDISEHTLTLDDGTVQAYVSIQPCSLEMLPEEDQRANQGAVKDVFDQLGFPIELYSYQVPQDLSQYPGTRDHGKTTHHCAVVRATGKDKSVEELREEAINRCRQVSEGLSSAGLSASPVTQPFISLCKNDLQRSSLARKEVNPEYYETIYVSNYPTEVTVGWLSDLLNTEGLVEVVQTVQPITDKQRTGLSRTVSKLQTEETLSRHPGNTSELRRAKQDAEDMLGVEAGGESLVNYGVYITARDSPSKPSEETLDQVKSTLRSHGIDFKKVVLQSWSTKEVRSTRHPDLLEKHLIVPSEAASAGFPFSTHDHIQDRGICLGNDSRNGMPVVVDRFSWDAPHIVRMGMTGSGKTVGTMLELLRSYRNYSDLQIRILDPKPDYKPLIDALDGESYVIGHGLNENPGNVARYIVENPSQDNTEELVEALQHIHRESCNNGKKTIVVVDEAHRLLTDSAGVSALNTLIREGRSHSVGVSILTQNSDDLTQSTEGQNILRNTGCYFFMRHQDVDHSAEEFFNLSQRESIELRKLSTGGKSSGSEAVIRGPVNTKLRIRLEDDERELLLEDS